MRPLSGREFYQAREVQSDVTHKGTIRYYPGLSGTWRFAYTDVRTAVVRYFNILSVLNIEERNRFQECMCQEAV